MNPAARIADAAGEARLKRRLAIFIVKLDTPNSARMFLGKGGQACAHGGKVGCT
jgi:hypothetical protein